MNSPEQQMDDFHAGSLVVSSPSDMMVPVGEDMKHHTIPNLSLQMKHVYLMIPNGQSTTDESGDDVFSYNCALLADGLFFLNFLDAGKEGDGIRLMRQYRYMLLYCRADGHSSNKYALEFFVPVLLCRLTVISTRP